MGEPVVDRNGEEMGRVDRILIELSTGRVAAVVVAVGGVFGLGERQYSVPWGDLRMDLARRRVVMERRHAKAAARLSTL